MSPPFILALTSECQVSFGQVIDTEVRPDTDAFEPLRTSDRTRSAGTQIEASK